VWEENATSILCGAVHCFVEAGRWGKQLRLVREVTTAIP
jgi:hypothetical protein